MSVQDVETTPDPIDVLVGERMKARRQVLGLSQADLGEAIGVSFQQVQKYERGTNRVSASMLCHAARALECAPAELLPSIGRFNRPEPIENAYKVLSRSDGMATMNALARLPRWAFNLVHDLAVSLDSKTRASVLPAE